MVFASGYCIARWQATRANSKADRSGVGNVKCRAAFGSTAQKTLAVPHRSYSLSRRASRPGSAGEEGRTSACSVTGFSSRHTTGSWGSLGFSYVSSTSSILAMYASLSSATHHIFFPPRLEVVVEEQNPDRFPSHAWDQPALHLFLGHQSHGPAGTALWRVAAHHGDDPLLLAVFQNRRSAGSLLVVESGFEATGLVTMADLPNRLWRERDHVGNPRCTYALGQLQER